MPLPTGNDLRPVDPIATQIAIANGNDIAKDFVADQIVPPIMGEQSGTYFIWNRGDIYRREMKLTAEGSPAPVAGFRVSTDTFFTLPYSVKTMMTDRERARASLPKMADDAHVYYLTHQGKMNRDFLFKDTAFKTGVWTTNTEQTGVDSGASTNEFIQWDDSSSTPLLDIQEQMLVVYNACGRVPTDLIINLDTATALSRHSDFTGRVTGGSNTAAPGLADMDTIARVLWSGTGSEGKITVAKAINNTADEGLTVSLSGIFGKNALLVYLDAGANPLFDRARPTGIATFAHSQFTGMTPTGATIKSWRSDDPDGTWRRVQDDYVVKITDTACGVFMNTVVA